MGSLSRLFSGSKTPYLYYRVAEILFCKSFGAENLSRSDTSADASVNGLGFGLKTFLQGPGNKGKSEKIAEFNNDSAHFRKLSTEKQVYEIAKLRNERIDTTKRLYGLNNIIYHSVTRTENKMVVIENPMHLIDIASIHKIKGTDKSISFSDKFEEYSFNISKSTLFKRFGIEEGLLEIPVKILNDPFQILERLFATSEQEMRELIFSPIIEAEEHVFLPLYSTRKKKGNKVVPGKSGLNQWNAGGRPRSLGEVYIPIPAWIHQRFPKFFPPRDQSFNLKLPDKRILSASICQQGNKALMTNPNEALGKWILRDVLNLQEGELLTYEKLEDIGLDAVVIYKYDEENYKIDFAKIGSYDFFEETNTSHD